MRSSKLVCGSVAAALLNGCAATKWFEKPTDLADQWSKQMLQYRIHPVFPPAEDIQVGDVFITCQKPYVPGDSGLITDFAPFPVRLTRIPSAQGALTSYYQGSVVLAPDPAKPASAVAAGSLKLRNLSLPEFFRVHATGGQFGALLPAGTTLAGIGISSEEVESVDVAVTSSGSVALPVDAMAKLVSTVTVAGALQYISDYDTKVCKPSHYEATAVVVNEVFAAYAISVSLNAKKSSAFAANAALALPTDSTRKAAFDALSQYFQPASAPAAAPAASAASTPTARDVLFVDTLKSLLGEANSSYEMSHPGVKVGFYSGTSAGVRMDREFSSPVVIGVRLLRVTPDKNGKLDVDLQLGSTATIQSTQ